MAVVLRDVRDNLPADFEVLLADSLDNGYEFLQRLRAEWTSGANRFSAPGECLLAAIEQDRLLGIGGINLDPYLRDASTGRIRHLYVHSLFRRRGVASAILGNLESDSARFFRTLTLRTGNPQAGLFYETAGFSQVENHPFMTHCKQAGRCVSTSSPASGAERPIQSPSNRLL